MKNILLNIDKQVGLEIAVNFDLQEYVDGDVEIFLNKAGKRTFLTQTQIKHFAVQFLNIIDAVLRNDKNTRYFSKQLVSEQYPDDFEQSVILSEDFVWKTIVDCYITGTKGFCGFLYNRDHCPCIEIIEVNATLLERNEFYDSHRFSDPETVFFGKISESTLKDWRNILVNLIA